MTIYCRFAKLTGEISRSEMVAITNHLQAEEISMAGVAPYGPDHASSEEPMDEIIAQYLPSSDEFGSEKPDRAVTIILQESGSHRW